MGSGLDTIKFFHFTLRSRSLKKKKNPDPITDQIFDKNSDQMPTIDPIKNNTVYKKNRIFCKWKFSIPFGDNEHHIKWSTKYLTYLGSKKSFRTHEIIFWNTEFDVFPL